ncbi:hypothetical protein NDU88_000591 [Pleurodeles waltl]|uniref:Uncharacterized protein n=1 Tax=Pleurodeles waltl TaxID=8319 RepID=A0AAV7P4D0_PLEWA|nr:hypothetical protein NDU88_000591 [Pleurodeles waltl]
MRVLNCGLRPELSGQGTPAAEMLLIAGQHAWSGLEGVCTDRQDSPGRRLKELLTKQSFISLDESRLAPQCRTACYRRVSFSGLAFSQQFSVQVKLALLAEEGSLEAN